jgi:hypothetical protein
MPTGHTTPLPLSTWDRLTPEADLFSPRKISPPAVLDGCPGVGQEIAEGAEDDGRLRWHAPSAARAVTRSAFVACAA